jgi:hypothetical protein
MKVLFFMGINFRGLVKNYKFVDFVVVPKLNLWILYFQHSHWVANQYIRQMSCRIMLSEVEHDIKVFILTVVENSCICSFSRIYLIEFEN